ncbi:hypothetical protein BGX24_010770 [Mortierella sp. AD032]|nr:hypothetical protein BGX24_010770 [Mortierella sp. AD032]
MASGLPLSGTKPVLANRLVTHLASIMEKVDHLEPEFFLHNNNNNNSTSSSSIPTTPSSNDSVHLPPSSFFSSITTNATTLTEDTTATEATIPLHNQNSSQKVDPEMMAKIKDRILPRSIVSIDIGIRNLAWVELSKDGKILRWAVEDLLVPSSPSPNGLPQTALKEEEDEGCTAGSVKKTKRRSGTKRVNKPVVVSPPYDPRAVALRLDAVMRTILESDSVEGIIMERQRFRSGGLHTMLDSTFKCGVVEGMIHSWFAFWQHEQTRRARRFMVEKDGEEDEEASSVFIESVPPRAVAVRWGIGASGAKAKAASSSRKEKQLPMDSVSTLVGERRSDAPSELVEGESDLALPDSQLLARPKKSLKYWHKKFQSRSIVDHWIYGESSTSSPTQEIADISLVAELSLPSTFRVRCSPAMREWYSQEQKRDDLSDCLLQAVAWFEWKGRAVQEAVERSMSPGDGRGEEVASSRQPKPSRGRSKRAPVTPAY